MARRSCADADWRRDENGVPAPWIAEVCGEDARYWRSLRIIRSGGGARFELDCFFRPLKHRV